MGQGPVERGAPLPRKASLGAQLAPVSEDEAKAAQIAPGEGAKVLRVLPGQTAEGLKLKDGDILVSIAGQKVSSRAAVGPIILSLPAGKAIEVQVRRAGALVKLSGVLQEKPKQVEPGAQVVYDQVVSKGKRIRVIATHPDGAGPFPTVFLIGGIGAYSVDGDFGAIPYGNTMGPLAKLGYATLRIDKPGLGDSEGPAYADLLFDDEFDAYLQALRLAKTMPFIDKNRIAVFGHSMGGAFGPLLAKEESLAGIAVSGTISKTWTEYWLENSRRQSLLGGSAPQDVDDEMRQLSAACHYLFNEGLSPRETIAKAPALAGVVNGLSPDGKTMSGVGVAFFQQLAKKNLVAAWMKTDAKVLTLWGENDFVSTRWDHEFVADILNAKKAGSAEFKVVPNSDHGFSQTTSMKDSLAKWGRGGSFNPNIVDILKEWLGRVLAKG